MSYATAVLAHSPVLYLPMNEASGLTCADASGNGHTGRIPGGSSVVIGAAAGFLTGEVGTRFPDRFAELDFDPGSAFPSMGAFTLDFWLKLEAPSSSQDVGFGFFTVPRWNCDLVQVSGTEMQTFAIFQPSADAFNGAPVTVPDFHCWHYWAFTFDGAGNVRTYLDGALVDVATNPDSVGETVAPASGGLWINSTASGDAFDLMHSAFYPSCLSAGDIAALYAAATPRQDAACFQKPLRLRHSSGHVVFESNDQTTRLRAMDQDVLTHDGTTMNVNSGGVSKLQVPIPSAPSPPTRWVGLDPSGGLAVHDILPVTATHGIAPVVPPTLPATTPTTCDQMRCGAAINMTGHLISLYQHWAGVLNPLSSIAIKLGVGAAIAAGGELILSAFGIAELAGAIFESITARLTTLLSAATIGLFDSPTPDEQNVIVNGAYCQLTCEGNVISPTAAQIQGWNDYLTAHSSSFSAFNMQTALFNALLDFTPLLDWQLQAQTATPSASCGTMTCP